MTPREIIAEAWAITRKEKQLRRWGIFSSFFETLLTLKLLIYQFYFLYAFAIAKREVGFFDDVYWLYEHVAAWLFFTIVISFIVLLVIEWFFPHLAMGAIIGLAAKSARKEKPRGGLVLALYNFFPIFAIHEFFILGSWATTLTACSLILRYVSGDVKYTMVVMTVAVWIVSNFLKFLASFAEEAVVIQRMSIFHSIGRSYKLILSHLSHIMFLLVLLFIISLRVMINAVMMLIIPAIVIGVGILLTLFLSHTLSYLIAAVVALALIGVASYFFGYLHVFKQTVWTLTYMELSKHKDLDVIE